MSTAVLDEMRLVRDASRKFLDHHASSAEVHRIASATTELDRGYWTAAAGLGWTSLLVSEAAGGGSISGHPVADLAVIAGECGRRAAPGPLVPCNVVAWMLSQGDTDRHDDALAAIIEGRAVATWALAEGRGNWDPSTVSARADRGDDGYRLTGVKHFVEAAPDADLFVVTARDPDGVGHFVVEKSAPGVTVRPKRGLDPTRAFGSVEFASTPVPATARLHADLSDAELAERALCTAIAIQTAETAELMRHVFDMTIDWVTARYAFGRVVGSYQAVKHRLAEHCLAVEVAEGVTTCLAAALDAGSADASHLASTAKVHIGSAAVALAQDAIQLHGGIGMTWEHDLHLYLRRASTNRVLYGDPAAHRERLCRLAGV